MNPGANRSSVASLQAALAFAKIVLKSDNVKAESCVKNIYPPGVCGGNDRGAFSILEGVGGQCQEK